MELTFRKAERSDIKLIMQFIRELAEYEKMLDQVSATEELIDEWMFTKQTAEVFFAVVQGKEIGYALYFQNFSTFFGKAGIYLEDLYVRPAYRGKGYGKAIIKELARIAQKRGCGRLEWCCLKWNTPSIEFYQSLGAQALDEWTLFRVAGTALKTLAE
ncbi:hypothetical protein SDC9_133349 [bioreactor metagenome]|uniref:N-acetyltransferase domain-containing protein n=1 Tax=bioreactor metagenome TaxID=1076179 RepID=A0A645D9Q6_9ZZZZ